MRNRSLVDAPNKVPHHQRYYQNAYKRHVRVWQIHPRSKYVVVPFQIMMWGTFGTTLYMGVRKALGYNTFFGKANN
ncbi:hypothetical protein F4778DRAFT_775744 [Xylariomycetidae sp. FL2044]|nr:hypothetical protein F4778DRAFT_775744 [Xylariomycetidae sp. FL2044]